MASAAPASMTMSDAEAIANATEGLLRSLTDLDAISISSEALRHAALIVADGLAVAASSCRDPELESFAEFVVQHSSVVEASLARPGIPQVDRFWAGYYNAVAMAAAEFDEGSLRTPCHAGLYTVPALLSEGEATGATIGHLLRATVVAYELSVRMASLWRSSSGEYPALYTHAKSCAVSAAMARGLMQGLTSERLFELIAIASTLTNAGPRNHLLSGALVRNVWLGSATFHGMMSLEWLRWGVRGLRTSNSDVFGSVFELRADVTALHREPASAWQIETRYHRLHAVHRFVAPVVDAILSIRSKLAGGTESIESIDIAIHGDGLELTDQRPATSLSARFSLPHVVAATMILGRADPDSFRGDQLANPEIEKLRERVNIRPLCEHDTGPGKWPCSVTVTAAGKAYHADSYERTGPKSLQELRADVLGKINRIMEPIWPQFGETAQRLTALDPNTLSLSIGEFMQMSAS